MCAPMGRRVDSSIFDILSKIGLQSGAGFARAEIFNPKNLESDKSLGHMWAFHGTPCFVIEGRR